MDSSEKEEVKTLKISILIFILCIILVKSNLNAQIRLMAYSDLGHSNVSEGLFLQSSAGVSYKLQQFELETSFRNDIISNNKSFFSGLNLGLTHFFDYKQRMYTIRTFFISTVLSGFVNERNYGVLLSSDKEQFNFKIGTGFKSIGLTRAAIETTQTDSEKRIYEIFNPLYHFSYLLNKNNTNWNVGVAVTNIDHFVINQATNPIASAFGHYKINDKVRLTAEIWYKTAGAFNLHVNYYGLFFRPGIIWELK